MLMEGKTIHVAAVDEGIYELVFASEHSVNTLNRATLAELQEAVTALKATADVRGLMITSTKDSFIVGADITEFMGMFAAGEAAIVEGLSQINALFSSIEELPFPTVAAINGLALGGGFEICLTCDYRVLTAGAKVGLPEVKLGIYPGWGGTVRLPRLIGVDNANEWICGGAENRADKALKDGAVDAVVAPEQLRDAALELLRGCIAGKFDYLARRTEKRSPIKLNQIEMMMAFESAKGVIGAKAGPHYPAPMAAIKTMQSHATKELDDALVIEAKGFAKLATNEVTPALVGLFLKDQLVKKVGKKYEADTAPVKQAAVLGAGIMGGGIAYQSASRGTPILMKDINEDALQLGLDEAAKLLNKQLERGKIDAPKMAKALGHIRPTLSYGDFGNVDLVVEAVVENPKVKKSVLAEVEAQLPEGAILASNTSTISITELATALKHPENFCGMHFFNPVHRMPLVEVIRGKKTSAEAVARTVAYAKALGKTPIVVNDCPGFLVNRVLFPYFAGFSALLRDGANYLQIDKVMEGFGWPMGPAYLLDVVGIDTACHADGVMAAGFPDRMSHEGETAIERLYSLKRLGQKNGLGFYRYELDRKGKPKKLVDEELPKLLEGSVGSAREFGDEEIIARMMIPLCIETVRCLEEGIVGSAAEADMALVYGIGFPPFRGGALYYIDQMGLDVFCRLADRFSDLGKLYQPTDKMREMAAAGQKYFGKESRA
ncbi:fatty acid oxidation complex subunit alpha FadB [Marinobacterium sp. D7]|uniref:fatty acid oxidation complex subunit alpha FadB n=1 Tax=Marinobacterium ramblicola TaxID=2849041 RepID=UPI001C2CD90C|nr:fatty acid oxidation complex subunit alpha FadB [Marinobacterium ramblicola]MBV1788263.1 fatty acid oxidation complex subunit alpha FadB [Marinobacterium ramblicola]